MVTVQVACLPLPSCTVAVIVAVPDKEAVIGLDWLTLATPGLRLLQVSAWLVAFTGGGIVVAVFAELPAIDVNQEGSSFTMLTLYQRRPDLNQAILVSGNLSYSYSNRINPRGSRGYFPYNLLVSNCSTEELSQFTSAFCFKHQKVRTKR